LAAANNTDYRKSHRVSLQKTLEDPDFHTFSGQDFASFRSTPVANRMPLGAATGNTG
jgi:hypothetical protein